MVEIWNSKLEVTWSAGDKATLDAAVALTQNHSSATYLEEVLRFMYQHSHALFVLISRKGAQEGTMTTMGILYKGDLIPHQISYPLAGTPCEQVQKHGICYFSNNTQDLFPSDEYLSTHGIESYLGGTLLSSSGEINGLVTLMHTAPLPNPMLMELILSILSPSLEALIENPA